MDQQTTVCQSSEVRSRPWYIDCSHCSFHPLVHDVQFGYLNVLCNKSLLLSPPVGLLARQADEHMNMLQDRVLPRGAHIVPPISIIHRDALYWSDPPHFKPERFLSRPPQPYSFLPFSAGARNCIGQKYANIRVKTTIICIVSAFKIQPVTQLYRGSLTLLHPFTHKHRSS